MANNDDFEDGQMLVILQQKLHLQGAVVGGGRLLHAGRHRGQHHPRANLLAQPFPPDLWCLAKAKGQQKIKEVKSEAVIDGHLSLLLVAVGGALV